MSNNHEIKEALRVFINEKNYNVALLKGEWGVGKTFLWKELMQEIIENKRECKDSFIYVSLFGLNTLDEVKSNLIFKGETEKKNSRYV